MGLYECSTFPVQMDLTYDDTTLQVSTVTVSNNSGDDVVVWLGDCQTMNLDAWNSPTIPAGAQNQVFDVSTNSPPLFLTNTRRGPRPCGCGD